MPEKGAEVERLITELPTTLRIEKMAQDLGLTKVETIAKSEFFDFANGTAFVESPLAADFLFPAWLGFLEADERDKVIKRLAETIDEDGSGMNFQFSVKATLLVGGKI